MNHLFWTDNFWIEGNFAWAVSSAENILFKLDFSEDQFEYITILPNSSIKLFRKNQQCIKCDNVIVCIPDIEKNIYFYNVDTGHFSSIMLSCNEVRICGFWRVEDFLYMLSSTLNLIFMVNVKEERIEKIYAIPLENKDGNVQRGVLIEKSIYFISSKDSNIYSFHMETGQFDIYHIPQIKTGLGCIGYDGKNFLLGGYRREIYIWNPEQGDVKVLNCFPKEFGIYNYLYPGGELLDCQSKQYMTETFLCCVTVKNRTWFVPFQTNMFIYVDKEDYRISSLIIEDEIENRDSLLDINRVLNHKYLLEYVREERYIGIYSIKNKNIFEIDSWELTVHKRKFELTNKEDVVYALGALLENCTGNICLREKNELSLRVLMELRLKCDSNNLKMNANVGKQIYQFIK